MLSQSGTVLGTPAMIGTSEPAFFLPDWEGIQARDSIGWLISELEAHDNLLEAFSFFLLSFQFCAVIFTSLCLVPVQRLVRTYVNTLRFVLGCLSPSESPP